MKLHEAIAGTYAVIGQAMTDAQLAILTEDLEPYPLPEVLTALSRCRKECRKLALVDILDRLPHGHPGPEEAWGIVSQGMADEGATMIWTEEMREAFGIANKVAEDAVGARMAFKESYSRLIGEARTARTAPQWSVSIGSNKAHRELAILEGLKCGRLSQAYAQKLLPREAISTEEAAKLLEQHFPKLLE